MDIHAGWTVMAFFLGLILGHRLSIARDVRRETNDAAHTVRAALLKERRNPTPMAAGVNDLDIDRLTHMLGPIRRRAFLQRYHQYQHAKTILGDPDKFGHVTYRDPQAVTDAIDRLLRHTEPTR